jgi:hypothetical protein
MENSYCQDGYCVPRSNEGETCTVDASCLSDVCLEGFCSDKTKMLKLVGESCEVDEECTTNRCDGWPFFSRCRKRSDSGEDCNEHSDCISGHCAGIVNKNCL